MQGKSTASSVKQLKDLDLNTMDKPKTLVILHYNRRRISAPLFKQVTDLSDLLYHHIATLQQKILQNDTNWQVKANQQIVCFQIKKQGKQQKMSDGDLRSDIYLSLLRIKGEQMIPELGFRADVTKVYKYIEVEPYYRNFRYERSRYGGADRSSYFHFQRIMNSCSNSNVYLVRRLEDGYYFGVRVFAEGSKMGLSQSRVVQHMAYIDEQGGELRNGLLVRSQSIVYIPHPEAESCEDDENVDTCRYVALVYPYMVRGNVEELISEARGRRRIAQMDCLNYLKELMWGMHLLHQKYNLVHRALSPSNISIDQNGQLRLSQFACSVPCYDTNGQYLKYCPKTRYPKSGYSLQQLFQQQSIQMGEYCAPELLHGDSYNYLVDFYSVGMIVKKLYELSQVIERVPVSQNNQNLMMAMIQKLTSSDLAERGAIVHQILEDISREDVEEQINANLVVPLTLQEIKVGRTIQIGERKFIESGQGSNGIEHEVVFDYFKERQLKAIKPRKIRRKSKEHISQSNSRQKTVKSKEMKDKSKGKQKSEKCLSKASDGPQGKRKVSAGKNKSFGEHRESREKNTSQKGVKGESPVRKVNKSKSHQKKKDPLTCTKLYTYHDEERRGVIIPKSPKGIVLPQRAKSPAMRQR